MYGDDLSSSDDDFLHDGDDDDCSSSDYSALDEPTKPQSAYGLFFQETQETIKQSNSASTFIEVSRIVAGMWESLDEGGRQLYRNKTEVAKRKYLQELAEYRAKIAAAAEPESSADEEEEEDDDEDDEPLSNLRNKTSLEKKNENIQQQRVTGVLPPPPKLKKAPGVMVKSPLYDSQLHTSYDSAKVQHIVLEDSLSPGSSSKSKPIQLRNMVPKSGSSPITVIQSKSGQTIKVLPPTATLPQLKPPQLTVANEDLKSRNLDSVQPILQTLAQENEMKSSPSVSDDEKGDEFPHKIAPRHLVKEPQMCKREKCNKIGVEKPSSWDAGYCSSKCVVERVESLFELLVSKLPQK